MSYKVSLKNQNSSFDINKTETVLEAALRQGHNLPYGCRNGSCGSCKAQVITGAVDVPTENRYRLSDEENLQGYVLLCQTRAKTDLSIKVRTVNLTSDIKVRQLPCRVSRCAKLTEDVIQLRLDLPKTERLQFLAGQHIDILLKGGNRRSFSLANPPHEDQTLELHIRHYDGGLFSDQVFNNLTERTIFRIEGPLGQFTLRKSDRPLIMIAGGTGFAPIKSIVGYLLRKNDKRRLNFYWGARTESGLYFNDLARKWLHEQTHINYIPVVSDNSRLNGWDGRTGYVHEAVLQDYPDLSSYDVYACGPPPMIDAIIKSFPEHGLCKDRFFSDAFEFAVD